MSFMLLAAFLAAPSSASDLVVAKGAAAQQTYATAVQRSLDRSQVGAVRIARPPRGLGPPGDRWIFIDVRGSDRFDLVRAEWQADLVTGAVHDASLARGWPRLVGETEFWVRPGHGRKRLEDAAMGQSWGPIVAATPRHKLVQIVKTFARSNNLRTRSVTTRRLHGGGVVVETALVTDHPREVEREESAPMWSLIRALGPKGKPPLAEGIFVEVQTADSRWVYRFSYSFRTSTTNAVGSPEFAS